MSKKTIYIAIAVVAIIILAGIYVDKTVNISTSKSTAAGPTTVTLGNYGHAPNFPLGDTWLNSPALTIGDLKGKVVLVDFWTYSCINCIRTLPYTTQWYNTYKDKGLVVIGVHTPEFAFEHDTSNVQSAITQFGIHYPVVQDNDYAIWNAYNNQYWPAEYLINQEGQIVEENFGEGNYTETENNIRQLLGITSGPTVTGGAGAAANLSQVQSPEMYFGTERLAYLTPLEEPSSFIQGYALNQNVALNNFSLGGSWQFSANNAQLTAAGGQINLKFHSGSVYMVAASAKPATLQINVDGKPQPPVTVQASKLYTLFTSQDYSDHVITITISQPGFEAFTFTFG